MTSLEDLVKVLQVSLPDSNRIQKWIPKITIIENYFTIGTKFKTQND